MDYRNINILIISPEGERWKLPAKLRNGVTWNRARALAVLDETIGEFYPTNKDQPAAPGVFHFIDRDRTEVVVGIGEAPYRYAGRLLWP
jgi:hypothetical protein